MPLDPPAAREAARAALRTELGLPPDSLLVAIVGRVFPEKGHARLYEALAQLVPQHPRVALLVMDKQFDDPPAYRAEMQALEARLDLSSRTRWLGFRDDVRRLMGLAQVGVVPSIASEVNCRVTVEFFSMGVPVVAFPTGALPEVIDAGVSGLVTADHTPPALAAALAPLLADDDLRERLGAGPRRQAETRFSPQRFRDETLAVFEAALGAAANPADGAP